MNNDSLQSTINANTLAINALKEQLENVTESVKKEDSYIQSSFKTFLLSDDLVISSIGGKMYNKLQTNISQNSIRLTWQDYSNVERLNYLDINYHSNSYYENKNLDNHSWEISCPSNRYKVNSVSAADSPNQDEAIAIAELHMTIFKLITNNIWTFVDYHNQVMINLDRQRSLQDAISKLERVIKDSVYQMERNRIVRIFKPGGETAKCLFNKDIDFKERTYFYPTRRIMIGFEAVQLLKEGKKGIRVSFISVYKNNEGVETRYSAAKEKWLTLQTLINLYSDSEKSFQKKEAKRIEEEKLALETQNA